MDKIREQIEILNYWAAENDKKETGEVGNFDRELADSMERLLAVMEPAESVCQSLEHETDHVSALQMWKLREAIQAVKADE